MNKPLDEALVAVPVYRDRADYLKTLLLFAAVSLYGQSVPLSLTGPSSTKAGQAVVLPLSTTVAAAAAVQCTATFPVDVATANVTSAVPAKTVETSATFSGNTIKFMLIGKAEASTAPAGALVNINATFKSALTLKQESFQVGTCFAAMPDGTVLAVTAPPPFVIAAAAAVSNSCDVVSPFGVIDLADTQAIIDAALGKRAMQAAFDIDKDGQATAADAQITIAFRTGLRSNCP